MKELSSTNNATHALLKKLSKKLGWVCALFQAPILALVLSHSLTHCGPSSPTDTSAFNNLHNLHNADQVVAISAQHIWEQVFTFDRHFTIQATWRAENNSSQADIVPYFNIVATGGWDEQLAALENPEETLAWWPRIEGESLAISNFEYDKTFFEHSLSPFEIALHKASIHFINERNSAAKNFSNELVWQHLSIDPRLLDSKFKDLLKQLHDSHASFRITIGKGFTESPYVSTTTGGTGFWRISGDLTINKNGARKHSEILEFGLEFQATLNIALEKMLSDTKL